MAGTAEAAADKRGIGGANVDQTEINSGSLGLFAAIVAEGNLLPSVDVVVRPLTAVESEGPFEFLIASSDADYLVLPSIEMEGYIYVEKFDTTSSTYVATTATDDFSIVNLAPYSLFKMLDVSLNNVAIEDVSAPVWPYKCFIETVLSHDIGACRTHLRTRGYLPDGPNDYAIVATPNTSVTTGYTTRRQFIKENKKLFFQCPLHASLFATGSRYLPPGVNVKIKLTRNNDAFTIMANTTDKTKYRIVLKDLLLRMKKVKVTKNVLESHAKSFTQQNAILPFHKSCTRPFVIPSGISSYIVQNAIVGEIPHTIIFGFVDATAIEGIPNKNPFVFEHNNLDGLFLTVNGVIVPSEPYELDYSNRKYYRAYTDLLRTCGAGYGNAAIDVLPEDFESFLTLYGFDLSPDSCSGYHQHIPIRSGQINIHLKFSEALTNPLKLLLYYVKHAAVAIDAARNVTLVDGLGFDEVKKIK